MENHKSFYEDAIGVLNNLQSNPAAISESIKNHPCTKETNRDNIIRYLGYTGISTEMLNSLSVIHIAGTKGKGTTSSLCESILRAHGYRTGFYSSPHLISVTERIRLDGKPIEKDIFATALNEIYQKLLLYKQNEKDLPAYFGFLTVMALNIFIKEKVDVAIVEVGIGGEYDQTNIFRKTPVVGITSLGLDHTAILGHTIAEIARQKAGIMKKDCIAFTVQQDPSAMEVLQEVSRQRGCTLQTVPDYESYDWSDISSKDKNLENPTKFLNASLAIQLAHSWMNKNSDITKSVNKTTLLGMKSSIWPGRCQIIKCIDKDVYLDGAHTVESMEVCYEWFKSHCRVSSYKVLLFYVTKGRDAKSLMKALQNINFDMVIFVPDNAFSLKHYSNTLIDQVNMFTSENENVEKCKKLQNLWKEFQNERPQNLHVFPDVESSMDYVSAQCAKSNGEKYKKPQVLVTGSLLLVGAALAVLDSSIVASR